MFEFASILPTPDPARVDTIMVSYNTFLKVW